MANHVQDSARTIHLAKLVNEAWSKTLLQRLVEAEDAPSTVELDMTRTDWLAPFGTVLLADFAMRRIEKGHAVTLIMPRHQGTAAYIETSGLLRITQSTNVSDAVQIETVQLRRLRQMEPMVPESLSDFVCRQAESVGEDERMLVRTWMTELLTIANDHARSESGFWICARYYPKDKSIRICVADRGIGIHRSLREAGGIPGRASDADAIVKALEEGVTSRQVRTGGLGLKLIAAYVKSHGGPLTILSGTGRVRVARKVKHVRNDHLPFQGTIVNVAYDASTMTSEPPEEGGGSPFRFEEYP